MHPAFVVNVYDPLNYDLAFTQPLPPKLLLGMNQPFTFYETRDILDVRLLARRSHPMPADVYSDWDYDGDCDLSTETLLQTGRSYRCHLKDLKFRLHAKQHPDFALAKRVLTQWTNLHNGWLQARAYSVDIYKRIIIDLTDPETGESVKDYLLEQFPTIFCPSREPNTTVHVANVTDEARLTRPSVFRQHVF